MLFTEVIQTHDPNDRKFDEAKKEIERLVKRGTCVNSLIRGCSRQSKDIEWSVYSGNQR